MHKKSKNLMNEWGEFKSFMFRVWVKRRGWIYDMIDISAVIEYWILFSDKRSDLYDLYPSNVQIYFMFKDLISVYDTHKDAMDLNYYRSIKHRLRQRTDYKERCVIGIKNKKYIYSKEYNLIKQRKSMQKKKEMEELLEKHKKSISAENDFF